MTVTVDATDAVLWSAACTGDSAAFETVFRRHADRVHTQCARRTGSYDAADDLVSTVFLHAWKKRDHVRFVDQSLLPWLLVVAANVTRNQLRSNRRHTNLRLRVAGTQRDEPHDLEDRLDARSLAPKLAAALSTLNDNEQAVVSLCDLSEYGQREAAEALAIPIGTVKSRLSRAHQKLRQQLGDQAAAALGLQPVTETEVDK